MQILRLDIMQDIMQDSSVYRFIIDQGREEGREEGRQEGEAKIVLKQLVRRVGALPESIREQIYLLSSPQLEALGESLLDFITLQDLEDWLTHQQAGIAKMLESLRARFGELLPESLVEVRQLSPEAVTLLETELLNWSDPSQLKDWLEVQKAQAEA
jgi:Domain of unknown function (DUF4351)